MTIDFTGVARGDDFWFRAAFLDDLWSCLNENNVLLVAPRRMGKTSVLYQLLDYPRDNFIPLYLNVETCATPADFIIQLILTLRSTQPQYYFGQLRMIEYENILSEAPGTIDPKEALKAAMDWQAQWEERASHLIDAIKNVNQPVLFMLDELPDMFIKIQNQGQLEPFLRWFRDAREIRPTRWIAAGSTSLVGVLDQAGQTKWIEDFYHLVLPPFSIKEVENFALKCFSRHAVRFDARVIPRMQELLGKSIPFFLQWMATALVDRWKLVMEEKPLTEAVVDEIFDKDMMGIRMLGHLQHYHSRIEQRYPEIEREAAYGLLNQLSRGNGVTLNDLFALYTKMESKRAKPRNEKQLMQSFGRLLKLLQIDFYVEDIGGKRYDFASRLLKVWWKKYHATS